MSEVALDAVVRVKNQAGPGAKSAADDLRKLGDEGKKSGGSLADFASSAKAAFAALAVTEIVQAAVELGKLGAQAQAGEQKLAALAGGADQAASYLRAIGEASGYTVDNVTATAAASKLLSMGLVENQQEAARMIEMAVRLGDSQQDVSGRISDFAALLANQSIPRLDNYGISSGRVRARIEELQAAHQGLSREAAFTQAVMEQGQQSLDRLGEAGTGTVQSFDRSGAAIANLKTELAKLASDALSPAAEGLYQLLTFNQRVDDSLAQNTQAAVQAGTSWEQYARTQYEAQVQAGRLGDIQKAIEPVLRAQGMTAQETANFWLKYNNSVDAAIALGVGVGETMSRTDFEALQKGLAAASQGYNDVGASAQKAAVAVDDTAQAIEASKTAVNDLKTAIAGAVGKENRDYINNMDEMKAKAAELDAELQRLERSQGAVVTTQSKSSLTAAELNLANLQLADAQRQLSETSADNALKQAQLGVRIEDLQGKINGAGQAVTTYVDNSKRIAETRGELDLLNAKMAETEAAHTAAMNKIVYEMMMARLSVDGLTESELELATTVAEKMGLIDQQTAAAMRGVNASIEAFNKTGSADTAAQLLTGIAKAAADIPTDIKIAVEWDIQQPPVNLPTKGQGPIAYANGGVTDRAGAALVGEQGPEIVQLPAGARVYNASETRQITNNYNMTVNGMSNASEAPVYFNLLRTMNGG